MNSFKKVFWYSIIIFIIDYVIKTGVVMNMVLGFSKTIISGFFNITYVQNDGGGFSILSGHPILLAIIGFIVIDLIYLYIIKQDLSKYEIWLYAMLTGGIIGNMFDRLIYHNVIDYLDFRIFSYNFPIFNFADMCITISIFLLIVNLIKGDDKYDNCNNRRKRETRSSLREENK